MSEKIIADRDQNDSFIEALNQLSIEEKRRFTPNHIYNEKDEPFQDFKIFLEELVKKGDLLKYYEIECDQCYNSIIIVDSEVKIPEKIYCEECDHTTYRTNSDYKSYVFITYSITEEYQDKLKAMNFSTEQKITSTIEDLKKMFTIENITKMLDSIKDLLHEKNKRYGDSALHPIRIFSKHDASNGISLRLDDKVNRIINAGDLRKNDVSDIIGYLVLLCISHNWLNFKDLID